MDGETLRSAVEGAALSRDLGELTRLNRALRMLSNSNQALIRIGDEGQLLDEICRIVVEQGGYRMAMVAFADDDPGKTLRVVASAGFEAGYGKSVRISWAEDDPHGQGPGGVAVRGGRPAVCRDIFHDPQFALWRDDAHRRGYRSLVALPLNAEGRPFGILGIYSDVADAFDAKEMAILGELAGDLAFGITASRLRANHTQLEEQVQADLDFFACLDQINRAMQQAGDLDQMMRDVLEMVLVMFNCDRASLLYPCDPEAPSWQIPMERTRPEHPGLFALQIEMPTSPEVGKMFRAALKSAAPIRFGTGSVEFPQDPTIEARFGPLSALFVAVYPKLGKPWGFMVHDCSGVHSWTPHEKKLVLEIARRLGDGLTMLLTRRDLETSESRLRTLVRTIPDLVWLKDLSGRYLFCNQQFERFYGAKEADIIGRSDVDFVEPELAQFFRDNDRKAIEAGQPTANDEWLTFGDGYRGLFETVKTPMLDSAGKVLGVLGVARDVSERRRSEEELRVAATAFEAQEAIIITDAERRILRVNRAFSEMSGYQPEDVVGRMPSLLKSGYQDEEFYRSMWLSIARDGFWQGEVWNRHKDGHIYPEWLNISAVKDVAGTVTHYVGTAVDITARKAAEREIEQLAYYDVLTQLPNRRLLHDRLHQALAGSQRTGHKGALLFIDLDNFKLLNDAFGHEVGDRLLVEVAQRLDGGVRDGDTVARLGGDEFVVMLEDLSESETEAAAQAKRIGEKLLISLNRPYVVSEQIHHSTPSIGITLFGEGSESIDELLKQADIAMYQAKAAGRNTVRFFDPEMQAALAARAVLEADLRLAIEERQFVLYYQPQVDAGGRVIGAEALLRWQSPQRGLVPPGDFIGVAEETGLILSIGQWVIEAACAQLKTWEALPRARDLHMAVNVSARQFRQGDFVSQVRTALERSGAPARHLQLELTESIVLDDIAGTIAKMHALKELGVGFAMDDFGTGYSSLSYLTRLPLNLLKIDRSFVSNLPDNATDAVVAQTIITLAASLGLDVIAEGVETEAQREFLGRHGCRACQGYLFAKPMPVEEFERLLTR